MDAFSAVTSLASLPGDGSIVPWRSESEESGHSSAWVIKYGQRHQMRRINAWPPGIQPPRKVRVYVRGGAFLLQWWEPNLRKNVAERVDGDLVAAVARAREVDHRLLDFKSSGQGAGGRRLRHADLVARFNADLVRRADAGEIEPTSVSRYAGALKHYLDYAQQPNVQRRWPFVTAVNREFALAFGAYLSNRRVSANGRGAAASARPMKAHAFVWDAVRATYEWAADADRGALLPTGFRNPFRRRRARAGVARDLFGEPDITVAMAAAFIGACDAYQLRLFAPMIFFGLRAAEPAYLFHEYVEAEWLRVPCDPSLGYTTKGKRDKRLPLSAELRSLLAKQVRTSGLLYVRRAVWTGAEVPPLLDRSPEQLGEELRRRVRDGRVTGAAARRKLRDRVLADAGATQYDHIEAEFHQLADGLGWKKEATLKDFRHLFLTSLSNAGMAEPYRQYLAGQAQSTAPVTSYTHLNQVREQYERAVQSEWAPLRDAFEKRIRYLGLHRQ